MSRTITESTPITAVNGITVNTEYLQTVNCTVASSRTVKYIVVHYTGNSSDTALANAKYFHNNDLSSSAHYFVDTGSIYQSVALKDRAWHCGASTYYHDECRNANSIGIEMCTSGSYTVSDAVIENTAHLAAAVASFLGISPNDLDKYILRHYDVTHKSCPAQWADDSSGFTAFKTRIAQIMNGAAVTEYTEINDIIWELAHRGIISDTELWLKKCEEDTNIYWFCRKLCQYIRTKPTGETADSAYTDIGQIVWDLHYRGIITDTELWTKYAEEDKDVYWLLQKGLHYCRTY